MGRKSSIITFTIMLLCLVQITQAQLNKYLTLRISPSHSHVKVGADIELEFTLKNISQSRVLVTRSASLHDFTFLEITDEHGKLVSWSGKITSKRYPPDMFAVLRPGELITFKAVISTPIDGYAMQRPGAYRIRAEFSISPTQYFRSVAHGAQMPSQPVKSNWVTIIVLPK